MSWYPTRYKAGSWMYVEFTKAISPLLSKGGKFRCEIDGVVTFCTTSRTYKGYDRRVAILINKDLDPTVTDPTYKVSIIGVS